MGYTYVCIYTLVVVDEGRDASTWLRVTLSSRNDEEEEGEEDGRGEGIVWMKRAGSPVRGFNDF